MIYLIVGLTGLAKINLLDIRVLFAAIVVEMLVLAFYFRTGHNKYYESLSQSTNNFITGQSIGKIWLDYLRFVVENGKKIEDDKGFIIEAPFVTITLNTVDTNDPIILKYGNTAITELYIKKMFSVDILEELGTTYGDKLFDFNGHDQIELLIKRLKRNTSTKRATISLLNPFETNIKTRVPCLTTIDLKLRNNKLHLYAFFRSQNALNSYGNMYGLSSIQQYVCKRLEVKPGQIHLFITSPHLYLKDLSHVQENIIKLQG
jgi:thymidylate synthase